MRRIIVVGAVIAAGIVVGRILRSVVWKRPETADPERQNAVRPWIDPVDGSCPITHPVKVKVASGIYHVPGSPFYERTRPERCYADAAAAEADGYRAAKAAKGSRRSA